MRCAVIDLSSTGVSTVIAEGDKASGIFEAIYKDRINISVIDYFVGNMLSWRGIEKIIDALISARSNCRAMGAEECYVISTSALRNIDNIDDVLHAIKQRTGIVINHLDGETEAYCDFVSNRKYSALGSTVLIDIGGGSVECCDLAMRDKSEMVCLDLGTLKLRNRFVADVFPTPDEAKKIKKTVRKKADEAGLPGKKKFSSAVLVGSINDAVYAVYREYCERNKLGPEFGYDKYKRFCEMLLTSSERTPIIMKAAPEKINSVPVAVIILRELLKRFKLDSVIVSDSGVKEGYLELVMTGEEKGEKVDLATPVPTFAELAAKPEKSKAKKSAAKKSTAKKSAKSAKPADKNKKTTKSAKGEKGEKGESGKKASVKKNNASGKKE